MCFEWEEGSKPLPDISVVGLSTLENKWIRHDKSFFPLTSAFRGKLGKLDGQLVPLTLAGLANVSPMGIASFGLCPSSRPHLKKEGVP